MIKLNKKYKYPFLYKKFIRFKINFLHKNRIYRFKKLKWQNFIIDLKKANYWRNIIEKYDHLIYHRFKFSFSFKYKFKNNLYKKQKLKCFYGYLKNKKIKKFMHYSITKFFTNKNNMPSLKRNLSFSITLCIMNNLESRLYMVLYRSFFASSVRNAKQLIFLGNVLVNNKKVVNSTYYLKKGDIISFRSNFHKRLKEILIYSFKNNKHNIIPNYLKINYSTFQILIVTNNLSVNTYSYLYPYLFETNYLLKYRNI